MFSTELHNIHIHIKHSWIEIKHKKELGLVAYAFNPSTCEAEAGKSLYYVGQPDLHSVLQAS